MENLCSEEILKSFENYEKVIEALASKRFISVSYKDFTIYVFRGMKRDYIVAPCSFCTCEDFAINYLGKSRMTPCYHVIGFKIAESQNKLTRLEAEPKILAKIVEEIVFDGISITLRKLLK